MPEWQRAGLGDRAYSYQGALPDGRVVDATNWPGGKEVAYYFIKIFFLIDFIISVGF